MIDKFDPILTIGTVAQKLNVAVQTVRLYEKQGLVVPSRSKSKQRLYSLHELERLQCIRKMITEKKMNIQGIKRMLSLLPCWEFMGGLDRDCRDCPGYYEAIGPCWSLPRVGQKCKTTDCRTCAVYRMEINCEKMKQIIYGHIRPENKRSPDAGA